MIYGIIITTASGIPILWKDIQEGGAPQKDKSLVSGLLSAMSSFSAEVFGEEFHRIEFKNLEISIIPLVNKEVLLGAVAEKGDPSAQVLLSYMAPEIEKVFLQNLGILQGREVKFEFKRKLEEIIETHTIRLTTPKYEEIKSLYTTLFPYILTDKYLTEYSQFISDLSNLTQSELQRQKEFDKKFEKYMQPRELGEKDKKKLLMLIKSFYNWDLAKVISEAPQIFSKSYTGDLAKLLFTKASVLGWLIPTIEDTPSDDFVNRILFSVRSTDATVQNLKAYLLDLRKVYSPREKPVFDLKSVFLKYDFDATYLASRKLSESICDTYLIVIFPLEPYFAASWKIIQEKLSTRSDIISDCLNIFQDERTFYSMIYQGRTQEEIFNIITQARLKYIETKQKLVIGLSKKDKREALLNQLRIHHTLNIYRYLLALILSINSGKVTLKDYISFAGDALTLIKQEIDLISSFDTLAFPSKFLLKLLGTVFDALSTYQTFSFFYSAFDISEVPLFVDTLLEKTFKLKAKQKIRESDYYEFLILISRSLALWNRDRPLNRINVIKFVDDMRNINENALDTIRHINYYNYLIGIANSACAASLFADLVTRDIDKEILLKKSNDLLERVAKALLLIGKVVVYPSLQAAFNYYHLIKITEDAEKAKDYYKKAITIIKSLLSLPDITPQFKIASHKLFGDLNKLYASFVPQSEERKSMLKDAIRHYDEATKIIKTLGKNDLEWFSKIDTLIKKINHMINNVKS